MLCNKEERGNARNDGNMMDVTGNRKCITTIIRNNKNKWDSLEGIYRYDLEMLSA